MSQVCTRERAGQWPGMDGVVLAVPDRPRPTPRRPVPVPPEPEPPPPAPVPPEPPMPVPEPPAPGPIPPERPRRRLSLIGGPSHWSGTRPGLKRHAQAPRSRVGPHLGGFPQPHSRPHDVGSGGVDDDRVEFDVGDVGSASTMRETRTSTSSKASTSGWSASDEVPAGRPNSSGEERTARTRSAASASVSGASR